MTLERSFVEQWPYLSYPHSLCLSLPLSVGELIFTKRPSLWISQYASVDVRISYLLCEMSLRPYCAVWDKCTALLVFSQRFPRIPDSPDSLNETKTDFQTFVFSSPPPATWSRTPTRFFNLVITWWVKPQLNQARGWELMLCNRSIMRDFMGIFAIVNSL